MSDDLTERLREIISAAKSRPKRSASGISGQTIEAMLRSVICQITEYELEFIYEAADTIDALRARVAELEAALRGLLEPFDDDPCRYDHHGYCQEHFVEPGDRCCVKLARDALKDRNETDPEREPDNRTDNPDNRLDGEREET